MNPSLPVRVGPGHLPMRLNFETVVGQLEVATQQRAGSLRLSSQNFHSALAQVNEYAFDFAAIGKCELRWRLHRNAMRTPALPAEQRRHGPQASPCLVVRDWFVKDEVRSAAQNLAGLRRLRQQRDRDRRVCRIEPMHLLQQRNGGCGMIKVHNQRVKPLLLQTVDGRAEVAEMLGGDPKARQDALEDFASVVVSRNQQCQQRHSELRGSGAIRASVGLPASIPWKRPNYPLPLSRSSLRLPGSCPPPPSERRCRRRRSQRVREPLRAAFRRPAGAFRSACPVAHIYSASAATPHGYPSYHPLWRM